MKFFLGFVIIYCLLGCKESNVVRKYIVTKFINSEVLTDTVFTDGIEGPAMNSNGDLFVVNFMSEGTIGVLKSDSSEFKLFINLPEGSIGNGIRFDDKDNMYIADYKNHNIFFIKKGTKEVQIFCQNPHINQPNDITLHKNGFGFASDPNWEDKTGNLLRFSNGKLDVIEKNMGTTNGIELSPDGKKLYVNESIQKRVWQYNVDSIGNLSNKQILVQFQNYGMDGMRCDQKGNIYLARYGKGVITIISKTGEVLDEVCLHGKHPTNLTFPKGNSKEIYVTMQDEKWVEKITF